MYMVSINVNMSLNMSLIVNLCNYFHLFIRCMYVGVCVCRRLERVKASKHPDYVVLYDRMKEKMEESERLQPSFVSVAEQLW